MEEILTGNYVSKVIDKHLNKLNDKECDFLIQLAKYKVLKLSEKQLNWYLSILSKYPIQEIMPDSVGDKLLKKHKGKKISDIEMNHIKSYGNIYRINDNIKKQLDS